MDDETFCSKHAENNDRRPVGNIKRIYRDVVLQKFVGKFFKKNLLLKELEGCKTILDLGIGKDPLIQFYDKSEFTVGVDLFEPYLEWNKKKRVYSQYVRADVKKIEFKENSFDAVLALELLEHLNREEGMQLIEKMHYWANKKIIVTVPKCGSVHNRDEIPSSNAPDGNILQIHISNWRVADFKKLGFKVRGIYGLKWINRHESLFWQVIADFTQIVIYHLPNLAFGLLCIKNMKK